jgi:hypothetical protein
MSLYCLWDCFSFKYLIYVANVLNVYNNERRTVTTSCISKKLQHGIRAGLKETNSQSIFQYCNCCIIRVST